MYEYVRRVNEGINKLKKYASFGQADEERWKLKCVSSEGISILIY